MDERSTSGSPAQDLAMIRRLMEDSRRAVMGGTRHYIVWGVLITVALHLVPGVYLEMRGEGRAFAAGPAS